jgi:uridine monophosphate synthetase
MFFCFSGAYSHKAAFVLCKTSNPGSNDLLTLPLHQGGTLLYEEIARFVTAQKLPSSLGLVVGATDIMALQRVRRIIGDGVWILAPGVGAQGGNLREALEAGLDSNGTGMLIPVSRGISGADNPKEAANKLVESIRSVQSERLARKSGNGSETSTITIQPHQREFIEFSLDHQVLKFGSFVLKSGRTSPYFFNAGLFASGRALHRLAKAYADTIMSQMYVTAVYHGVLYTKLGLMSTTLGPCY